MDDAVGGFIRAGIDELRDRGVRWGHALRRGAHRGRGGDVVLSQPPPAHGLPLHRGSIEDGILTCHWHHARFDLRSGSTFDLWRTTCPRAQSASSRAKIGWRREQKRAHWRRRSHDGLPTISAW